MTKIQLRRQQYNYDGENTSMMAKTQLRWQKHNGDDKNTVNMKKKNTTKIKKKLRW